MGIGNALSAAGYEETQAVPARRACFKQEAIFCLPRKSDYCFGWSVLVFSFFAVQVISARPVEHVPVMSATAFTVFLTGTAVSFQRRCSHNAKSMLTAESCFRAACCSL